jgi:hypothetical protein
MNDAKHDNNLSMNKSTENQNDLSISREQLSNGFEYTKINNNNPSSKRRKLILHFDNRNTLQVSLYVYLILFVCLLNLNL